MCLKKHVLFFMFYEIQIEFNEITFFNIYK